jgi:hypothetical protein
MLTTCRTNPNLGWILFENDAKNVEYQTVVVQLSSAIYGAWSLTWRERPAWKHSHWEHFDVTHETSHSARGETP